MVVDALSHWKHLLTTMTVIVLGFEELRQDYADDKDFGTIYLDLLNGDQEKYTIVQYDIHDGFLFKGIKLCLPSTSIREHVVRELHSRDCSGHLGPRFKKSAESTRTRPSLSLH